ncbi:hypothetical protein BD770DRAFT_452470 [Pilaira anomala]|nr:hypothetical protein BD770DRAFT_452470 [Pilaira anomala]
MVQFSSYYNTIVHNLKAYWDHHVANSPLLTTTPEKSSSLITDYTTYNGASMSVSNYIANENFMTITADINLPSFVGRFDDTKKPIQPRQKHIVFSAATQHDNRAITTQSSKPQTNLYRSGLDFLFPPEKKAKCAISVTAPDKQQRLIHFSDRVQHEWIRPYQLLESNGEIKCTQVRTGERDYNSFLFYFVVVSLLFNIFLGIYIQYKYRHFLINTTTEPDEGHQEIDTGAPNPRENIVHAAPTRNVDQENIPEGSLVEHAKNILRRVREMRINNEQEVLRVRRDISAL